MYTSSLLQQIDETLYTHTWTVVFLLPYPPAIIYHKQTSPGPLAKEKTLLTLWCGNLSVPVDYVNTSSNSTMHLSMVKLGASKQPKQITILLKPGGSGGSGREIRWVRMRLDCRFLLVECFIIILFDPRYIWVCDYLYVCLSGCLTIYYSIIIPILSLLPSFGGSGRWNLI